MHWRCNLPRATRGDGFYDVFFRGRPVGRFSLATRSTSASEMIQVFPILSALIMPLVIKAATLRALIFSRVAASVVPRDRTVKDFGKRKPIPEDFHCKEFRYMYYSGMEKPQIPLHVRLVRLYPSPEDRLLHQLEFGVVGVPAPAKVTVSSDLYSSPVIETRECRGEIELPDRLMDDLAIKCFGVITGFVTDYDGESGTWTARDITAWLRRQFAPADAEQIERALRLQVDADWIVRDQVVVSDDDAVLADDHR